MQERTISGAAGCSCQTPHAGHLIGRQSVIRGCHVVVRPASIADANRCAVGFFILIWSLNMDHTTAATLIRFVDTPVAAKIAN